jgi:hypothetical protein
MRGLAHIFLLFICFSCSLVTAQEKNTGPKEKSFKSELKTNKQFRFEQREKRRKERAEKKAVKKYHKRLQTKKVLKRMKTSKRKSVRVNDNSREPFVKRWFQKRSKKGGRAKKKL